MRFKRLPLSQVPFAFKSSINRSFYFAGAMNVKVTDWLPTTAFLSTTAILFGQHAQPTTPLLTTGKFNCEGSKTSGSAPGKLKLKVSFRVEV